MPLQEIQPLCSNCQTPLNKIKGKFGTFWGCPNYQECKFKGFSADKEQPKIKPEVRMPETPTRDQVIMEELQGLREEMIQKFGALKDMLVIISNKIK